MATFTAKGIKYIEVAGGAFVPASYVREKVKVRMPVDALAVLAPLRCREQEVFAVVTLNGAHEIIRYHEVTIGLANQTQMHPRECFLPAIKDVAVGVILAHNHPSGSCDPSTDDLLTTRRLVDAGHLLGIPVLDHLIVTATSHISLRERFPDYFDKRTRGE